MSISSWSRIPARTSRVWIADEGEFAEAFQARIISPHERVLARVAADEIERRL
jgi:hypothetical protein